MVSGIWWGIQERLRGLIPYVLVGSDEFYLDGFYGEITCAMKEAFHWMREVRLICLRSMESSLIMCAVILLRFFLIAIMKICRREISSRGVQSL